MGDALYNRAWRTVRRALGVGGGGSGGATISLGTDGESISKVLGVLAPQSFGQGGESLAHAGRLTASLGVDGESLVVTSVAGVASASLGTDGESLSAVNATLGAQSFGTNSQAASWSSTGKGTGYPATATNTRNAGTHDWAPTANALGAFSSTGAVLSAAATTTVADSFNATLKLSAFALPTTVPAGFTLAGVEVGIQHKYDCTVAVLDTVSLICTLRKADGTQLGILNSATQADPSVPNYITGFVDVLALGWLAGLTNADIAAMQVWCVGVCALGAVTAANASWDFDGAYIRLVYTRAAIT